MLLCLVACGSGGDAGSTSTLPPGHSAVPHAGSIGDGRLDELLEWARSSQAVPVPAIAVVVVQGGQIAESAAVGRRSDDFDTPVTSGDRWHLGSLTKAITATLAGVLVEQSIVRWQTTPLDIWPELAQDIHPDFRHITLTHLLSHTSGMRNLDVILAAARDDAPGTLMEKRRLWAAALLAEAPVEETGQYLYSNAGYVVAGAMLATASATPWETLVSEQVFGPLGMHETGFGAPGSSEQIDEPWGHWDLDSFYKPVPPGPGSDNARSLGPSGTVHSSLTDYAQFILAHIAGARGSSGIATASTFNKLHTPVANNYALGWGVVVDSDFAKGLLLQHNGSNGRWYAEVRIAPQLDAGALIVVNAGGDGAQATVRALGQLLEQRVTLIE